MRCEPGRFAVRPTFNQHSTSNSQDSIANYLFGGDSDPLREVRVREEQTFHSILEIVLIRGVMRFQTTADKFLFAYLGERKKAALLANFALLLRDVMKYAPQTLVNRGAYLLREETASLFEYPSKNAFYEEITWMLWQMANAPKHVP